MISSNREVGRRQHETDFALTADFEDGERGQDPRNVGSLEKSEKAGKWILPSSFQKEHSPAGMWISAQGDHIGLLTYRTGTE